MNKMNFISVLKRYYLKQINIMFKDVDTFFKFLMFSFIMVFNSLLLFFVMLISTVIHYSVKLFDKTGLDVYYKETKNEDKKKHKKGGKR